MPTPLLIAHRGASGYLPEHTLPAKALAHAQGADYLEQDLVLTRDGVPIVLHDIHLDTVTDVALSFPERARHDGRFYAIDFAWEEIQTLRVHERVALETGQAVYPRRFPVRSAAQFRVPSLEEELAFIAGLNRSTGRVAGIYPELKAPAFHRREGYDLRAAVLPVLERYGWLQPDARCFLQCFDPAELEELRSELGGGPKLVQLLGENAWGEAACDYDQLRTTDGLSSISDYADAIGPGWPQVAPWSETERRFEKTSLGSEARARGLAVHAYTFRVEETPPGWEFEEMVRFFAEEAGLDGLFTDFPDRARRALG